MARVHYKFHDYKGCPGITILHVVLDMAMYPWNIAIAWGAYESFTDGDIRMGIISILVAIVSFFVYSKLENKLDSWGKAEEAKKKEQREVFVQTASPEEIAKLEKKEKKDGILTTFGVIMSIIIVIPTMASIFILCLMQL